MSYSNFLVHKPVMINEVLQFLAPQNGEIIVDATFGAGGYSQAILEQSMANVIAFDRDPDVITYVQELKQKYNSRLSFINDKFSLIKEHLEKLNIKKINGLVMDLGVSSMQLEEPSRGFSFMNDAFLDMRMGKDGITAREVVNSYDEKHLADIIYQLGDERNSRKIAKNIVTERRKKPIETTKQLAKIIQAVSRKMGKIDPATKTFQALRIYINQELEELTAILSASLELLAKDGRLVVVSFHSLEDRIVKNFLKDHKSIFSILTKKVVKPQYTEIRQNRRSRSARLRAAMFEGAKHD